MPARMWNDESRLDKYIIPHLAIFRDTVHHANNNNSPAFYTKMLVDLCGSILLLRFDKVFLSQAPQPQPSTRPPSLSFLSLQPRHLLAPDHRLGRHCECVHQLCHSARLDKACGKLCVLGCDSCRKVHGLEKVLPGEKLSTDVEDGVVGKDNLREVLHADGGEFLCFVIYRKDKFVFRYI